MTNTYPRETNEFVPVTVTVNGVATITGVTFSVVADGTRPTSFVAAVTRGAVIGIVNTGYAPGRWRIYAKGTDSPYTPVIDCGVVQIV